MFERVSCLWVFCLAALPGVVTAGTTYYVSNSAGNDSNNGLTPATAWKTLTKANGVTLTPGDQLLFRRGDVWNGILTPKGSGTAVEPILIGSYGNPGETSRPRINASGSQQQAIHLLNMQHLILEGFELTNAHTGSLDNRRARGVLLEATTPNTVFENITLRDLYIHDIDGAVIQAQRSWGGGIFFDSANNSNARFRQVLIENNTIIDCTTRGISGDQGQTNWTNESTMHESLVIRGNHIENTGCDAIRVVCWKDVLVEFNTIYHAGANTRGIEASYIAAAFPQQSINTTWQFNEIAYTAATNPDAGDMDSQPFDIDHNCGGTHTFQYNYTHNNAGGFFLFMGEIVDEGAITGPNGAFGKGIVRYNVSVNDGKGIDRLFEIHSFGGKRFDLQFYNDVFYYSGTSTADITGVQLKGSSFNGVVFSNNIFSAAAGSYPNTGGVIYRRNLYHRHNGPATDATRVNADPQFLGAGQTPSGLDGASGYQVAPISPAAEAGIVIADNGGRDHWGNAVSSVATPAIGAHEVKVDINSPVLISVRSRKLHG